jgi:predicted nucleic acid-binding protein
MIVVSDTSPLIVLAKIGYLELLKTIGTVGILEISAEINLVNLSEVFSHLKKTDFRISHAFLDQRLQRFDHKRT